MGLSERLDWGWVAGVAGLRLEESRPTGGVGLVLEKGRLTGKLSLSVLGHVLKFRNKLLLLRLNGVLSAH